LAPNANWNIPPCAPYTTRQVSDTLTRSQLSQTKEDQAKTSLAKFVI